ncbi:MAG TPA: aconitate hydratase [Thermoanaerobaculia bacterium]|nr:aconitate hydratase [Thermoanaerobaculia bacterium]
MAKNVTQKLIETHLVDGEMTPGEEIGLKIDQTLTQDATGTLVMLELEAMNLDRARTETSVQYVDHNLIQEDFKNPDDHLFLRSACRRFGLWFSRPGNGVSHPVHQERFGKPGKTMAGSDSHTPAAGAIGMLAVGAGGLEVALAIAGEPLYVKMPKVWGIQLEGELPPWVSAKDVILELLRRHGVDGGVGKALEYFGPGLAALSAMDRHVIANMGTELGATSSVFPADEEARRFLASQGREDDWSEWVADPGAEYDEMETLDLGSLEPLIAMPSSPGNVERVREVAGRPIYQAYVGSSANPGFRDFAMAAAMVEGRRVAPEVSFDVNPTSRQILANLVRGGQLAALIASGARIHQAGCNGCIGMGQAPASGKISLRTVPRNFPGRSGTKEDQVCLVSPETATASALAGVISDPRDMEMDYPRIEEPDDPILITDLIEPPLAAEEAREVELAKGPNIVSLPEFDPLPERLEIPVLLKVGDDISTDEIMPAGARVLPFRSNIPKISEFCFDIVDETYHDRALEARDRGGHAVVAGANYGQGSSREHAALAPRFLGLRLVVAKGFARIHWQNLANFGVLAVTFVDPEDYDRIESGDRLVLEGARQALSSGARLSLKNRSQDDREVVVEHRLSERQVEMVLAGGVLPAFRRRHGEG